MTAAPEIEEPNDPTRSGVSLPDGQGAHLSCNEIETLCVKAARGAGMSWGMAEEAGFAAGWLAKHGLDGPGALLAQLNIAENRPWRDICPIVEKDAFRSASGGLLCPVALGAALCDHARLMDTATPERPLQIGPVGQPVLLLPFLADMSRLRDVPIQLDWPHGRLTIGTEGEISGEIAQFAQLARITATLSFIPTASTPPSRTSEPPFVGQAILAGLNAYALRTTVPASAASRADAGAETGDND